MAIVIDHMDAHLAPPPAPSAVSSSPAGAAKPDAAALVRIMRLAAERSARLAAD